MQPVDSAHIVVDLCTLAEIAGAVEADLETGQVRLVARDGQGVPVHVVRWYPGGIRVVRRQ